MNIKPAIAGLIFTIPITFSIYFTGWNASGSYPSKSDLILLFSLQITGTA